MAPGAAHRPRLGALGSTGAGRDVTPRLRRILTLVALALAAELLYIALASPRLAVREVALCGDPVIVCKIAEQIDLPADTNILRAPIRRLRAQIEGIPAVQHAHISRDFPGRLVVTIARREAVAVIRRADAAVLVDPTGVPFTVSGEWGWGLPELAGPNLARGRPGDDETRAEIAALLRVLHALGPDPRLRASRLQLVSARHIEVTLDSGPRVNLGDTAQLAAKAELLAAALDQLEVGQIAYLDLSDPHSAFWRPRVHTASAPVR